MVTHHGKRHDINAEYSGKKLQPILDELLAVIKALPGNRIDPAQKRPPDTPIHAVVNPDLSLFNNMLARHASHDCPSLSSVPSKPMTNQLPELYRPGRDN